MERAIQQLVNQPTVRKHLSLFLIGVILGILVFGFVNFEQAQDRIPSILSGLLGVSIVYVTFYSNTLLNRFFPWRNWTGVRLLTGILWNSTSAYALIGLGIWSYDMGKGMDTFNKVMEHDTLVKLGVLLFCGALIYNVFYFAFYSYNQYSKEQVAALRVERKQAELQLAALKAQLSPHFLFNCMNSLSALFQSDVVKAEAFIRAMAKSYQYTLGQYTTSLTSVREELEFVHSYGFLLRTRFGEGFHLKVHLDAEQLERKIPPLTLQILVENALKHNTVSSATPIQVHISGTTKELRITNNKVPKKEKRPAASTGIGLKNITARYRILSKNGIRIEDAEDFIVTVPLLS
ncbi:MAG: histidine kinase [Bacteroidota bacterium]